MMGGKGAGGRDWKHVLNWNEGCTSAGVRRYFTVEDFTQILGLPIIPKAWIVAIITWQVRSFSAEKRGLIDVGYSCLN